MARKLTSALVMIGSPERQADLLYKTGFLAPDDVVYFSQKDKKCLVVSSMEVNRARAVCRHLEVLTPAELGLPPGALPVEWARALLKREKVKKTLVPYW